jgi:hypothetical protein
MGKINLGSTIPAYPMPVSLNVSWWKSWRSEPVVHCRRSKVRLIKMYFGEIQ